MHRTKTVTPDAIKLTPLDGLGSAMEDSLSLAGL